MIKGLMALLVAMFAIGAAWHQGGLADFYASYPERIPLVASVPNYYPAVISHRGDAQAAPENTIPAIYAAIENNIDYVEIDVRVTADGVPVLMHDNDVDRTTNGEGDLANFSFSELRKLDAGSWFSPEFTGTLVPTLEEALAAARGKICVLVDLKSRPNRQVVLQLKASAADQEKYCLLISLPQGGRMGVFAGSNVTEEQRERIMASIKANNRSAERSYKMFRRYWPEFPLSWSVRSYETVSELAEAYPSLVALEISGQSLSVEAVHQAHELGLYSYFRAETEELSTEKRVMGGVNAGIDAFFVSRVDSFREVMDTIRQKADVN